MNCYTITRRPEIECAADDAADDCDACDGGDGTDDIGPPGTLLTSLSERESKSETTK